MRQPFDTDDELGTAGDGTGAGHVIERELASSVSAV
jgi:hypothetical protein